MNFLSKTLSTLTGTSIPYTFKDKIEIKSIWTIYNGTSKDGTSVTIFEMSLKDALIIQLNFDQLGRNAFKKAKLVKFPELITIIDFIENDTNLYIVTEAVVPLSQYLKAHDVNNEAKLLGFYNIAKSLEFLNTKCQILHGNINIDSIFVNKASDWKLFGFELLTNLQSDPDQPIYRLSRFVPNFNDNLPEDVQAGGMDAIRKFPTKFDSYLFGKLLQSLINDKNMQPLIRKLINPKSSLRITIERFLVEGSDIFESNTLVRFNKDLKELQFKNNQEKLAYFKFELPQYFDESSSKELGFPPGFLEKKLLPELVSQFTLIEGFKPTINSTNEDVTKNQESLSILLNYILKFGIALTPPEFDKLIKPIIVKTFSSSDRSIRLILLNHLHDFEKFFNESEMQTKIFYNLLNGFQDTNFLIRETTLTSINLVVDKISVKQINQDLLKILAKSQMDPKPSIRVNTLILLIKVSSKVYQNSKNNVLITALSKSLKDTFVPCKMMALSGFEKLIDEFSLEEICSKILGQLAISLMDNKSSKVRNEAKRVFQLYFNSVESHAANLPDIDDDEEREEREFFKKYAPNVESTTSNEFINDTNANSGLSFGWNVINKLVASSALDGQLNKDFNNSNIDLSTPISISTENLFLKDKSPTPKSVNEDHWENDISFDDGWGNGDVKHPNKLSAPKAAIQLPRQKTTQNTRKGSTLKLGKAKKAATTLDLKIEEDSWDGSDDW